MGYRSKYTGSQLENILDNAQNKQDKISDLETIRSGARKGATALQSIPSEYITQTELNNKGYATISALDNKMDKVTLATVATSGNYNDLSDIPDLNNYIGKTSYLMPTNGFSLDSLFGISYLNNALYAADKRLNINLSGFDSSESSNLFDASYETSCIIGAGNVGVITITNNGNTLIEGYPYGYIYLSFYYTEIPENVSVKGYCNYEEHGIGWKEFPLVEIKGHQNGILSFRNDWYDITQLEITINAKSDTNTSLTQIDWHLDRASLDNYPVVTKFNRPQTLYGEYTFEGDVTLNNANLKTINGESLLGSGDITVSGGSGADWNATENEAGYIANKPFNEPMNVVIPDTNQYTFRLAKENTTVNILCDGNSILHFYPNNPYNAPYECDDGEHYFDFDWDGNGTLYISETLAEESLRGLIEIIQEKGALNTDLIPNTVLKTTPQSLTDEQQQQILENLGISGGGAAGANVMAVDTGDAVEDVNISYATTDYVDGLIGDINSVLESIING